MTSRLSRGALHRLFDERAQDSARREVLLDEGSRRLGVMVPVRSDILQRRRRGVDVGYGKQARAAWDVVAEPRVLRDHGTAAGQIASGALAEPTRARAHVAVFCDCEFTHRGLDVVLVGPRVLGYVGRITE